MQATTTNKHQALVVITGASEGIGKALAIQFGKAGNPLLLISRHIQPIKELEEYQNIQYTQLDVSDYQQFEKAVREAETRYGPVECMVNNAGMINIGAFRDMDIEKCHAEIDVLYKGVINGIKIVLSDMAKRKSGTIINVSSIGDRRPYPEAVTYHASKHAVYSVSESLQQAEAENNVRIVNIAPGLVKTNIHSNMGISFEQYSENFGNPVFLQSEEMADIIYFCWNLPQHICIRDLVVLPTSCGY